MISAYFHSIDERKSEEGFNSINLVPRQVDAFCGLWVRINEQNVTPRETNEHASLYHLEHFFLHLPKTKKGKHLEVGTYI